MSKRKRKHNPPKAVEPTVETTVEETEAVEAEVESAETPDASPAPTNPEIAEGDDRSREAGAHVAADDPQPASSSATFSDAETSETPSDSGDAQADAEASAVVPAAPPIGTPESDEPSADGAPSPTVPAPVAVRLPQILLDGTARKNPVLVAGLGLAPALLLADAAAALTIGVCTTLVLLVTSLLASLCGKYLPEKFRPALFTLVAAGLTVALEFGVGELLPGLLPRTGIYIALIAVGGLTLARAEYSTARPPLAALVDALANGVGCTLALTLIGALREIFGAGSIFGVDVTFDAFPPMTALTTAAGGFILVGLLAAAMQGLRLYRARRRAARAAAKSNDKEVSV